MAHFIEKTVKVKLSAESVWQVLADFSSVEKFATTIKSSPIIGDIKTGLGAKRLCTFNDGSSLVEEITEFQQGHGFKMELSEYSLPLKRMSATMKVTAIDKNSCELTMSSEFVVKAGPLGWVMGQFLMRPMMKGVFTKLLSGLAYHVETGECIVDKLPKQQEYAHLIVS